MNKFKPPTPEVDTLSDTSSGERQRKQPPPFTSTKSTSSYFASTVPTIPTKTKKFETMLGKEKISKSKKIIASIGAIEELISYIGVVNTKYYHDIQVSDDNFSFFILVQETLYDIINILNNKGKGKITPEKMSNLQDKYTPKNKRYIIPSVVLEAEILHLRSICRRAERQVISGVLQAGFSIDNSVVDYLNLLGEFLYNFSENNLEAKSDTKSQLIYNP